MNVVFEIVSLSYFLLLLSLLLIVNTSDATDNIDNRKMIFRSLEQCKDQKNLSMVWDNLKIGNDGKDITFSVNVKIGKEISKNLSLTFSFWKCDTSGNPDSCETALNDLQVPNVCENLIAENQAWSTFIHHFDKPLICPLAPGIYTLNEMPVNTEILNYIPISDAFWKLKVEGYDNGKKISCVNVVVQIISYNANS